MKNTINITVKDGEEYKEFAEMLINRDFIQIGTRLFEDKISYVRITIQ